MSDGGGQREGRSWLPCLGFVEPKASKGRNGDEKSITGESSRSGGIEKGDRLIADVDEKQPQMEGRREKDKTSRRKGQHWGRAGER